MGHKNHCYPVFQVFKGGFKPFGIETQFQCGLVKSEQAGAVQGGVAHLTHSFLRGFTPVIPDHRSQAGRSAVKPAVLPDKCPANSPG